MNGNAYVDAVREAVKEENAEILIISARTGVKVLDFQKYIVIHCTKLCSCKVYSS